ncbi:probable NAD(P)H dehydrogenase (quinone) FQR1-like 2 isoform X1 [Miscanthus floridulus]|uniref:probable NAD(P)H dehydrogenase (quinone) FQR1-like 2 isoform X1 n=1 Tax=Miscanthus floridulus TaxID=154761 RepID=UPI00345AD767
MYGHVESLARRAAAGAGAVDGLEAVLRRGPETLPPEVLEKMQAPPKDPAVPVIASATELQEADGVLFGFPTRYGAMAAQMKAFFDSTGSLWEAQKLAGKPAGFFVSTGTQGGGQETTASRQAHAVVLYKYMPNKSLDDPPVILKLILPFLGDCAVQGGHFLRKLLLDGRRFPKNASRSTAVSLVNLWNQCHPLNHHHQMKASFGSN